MSDMTEEQQRAWCDFKRGVELGLNAGRLPSEPGAGGFDLVAMRDGYCWGVSGRGFFRRFHGGITPPAQATPENDDRQGGAA
jgi:hypothetical protein